MIGIFDSGVGGLSVAVQIAQQLPNEKLLYYADSGRAPWGVREPSEIRYFAQEIARFLISQGAKIVVVACNTASVHSLAHLRGTFPDTPFVGMVPAIKPAVKDSRTRKVGLLATAATIHGQMLADLVNEFAVPANVQVLYTIPEGLVEQIEKGELRSPETKDILERSIEPLLAEGADTIILGCSHYPFVAQTLKEITHGRADFIDPAPAIARQCARVLEKRGDLAPSGQVGGLATMKVLTSGNPESVRHTVDTLIGKGITVDFFDVLS